MHAGFEEFSPTIQRVYNGIFIAGILTLLLGLTLSYELAIRIYTIEVIIALPIAIYILVNAYLLEGKAVLGYRL